MGPIVTPYFVLACLAMLSNASAGLGLAAFGLACGLLGAGLGVPNAWAADVGGLSAGGGPFDKIKQKSDSFVTSMIDIAVPICALAICVSCYMMFTGKMPKTYAMCIIGASVLIGSSVSIAQYLIK